MPEHCRHERGHITDSRFYGDRYATAASRHIFCDICRKQRWLDIEAALALTQGELGVIPAEVAEQIAAVADLDHVDLDQVQAETERSGHSLIGLLRALETACGPTAGQFIHFGATTQDIQDTGQSLEARDVLDTLSPALDDIIRSLTETAGRHSRTIGLGRTHAQPALPMAFGLKVASWLDELLRHRERVTRLRAHTPTAQLFGGAGTMASFDGRGRATLERFAERLGLVVPDLGWHVARDRVTEFVSTLAMVTGTLARMADEIRTLSRPEFGEVEEAWRTGKVGSSTMPHKRNPERCEQIVALSRLAAAQAGLALTAMVGDHERDARSLRLEWACVPDVSHYCLAAAEIATEVVTGLIVHPDRLAVNVETVTGQVMSERVMFALGEHIGKQQAHEYVYQLMQEAHSRDLPVRKLAASDPMITDRFTDAEQERLFEPASYLGESPELTMRVVERARATVS
ncbi:class-II fumarase/aspartase family protein [Spirillospora sp. NBC_01491]|uniref:class-II fumarase/aspartase family protein n=1 Tax=Spirillospora sp. NBC_01491 TaxID=2976007 RepID=UPI002E322C5F|nr:adenylosuccinate lyase family protein [Spirillospora sp. NBC_01491]